MTKLRQSHAFAELIVLYWKVTFEDKALSRLARLPRLSPSVWDKQGAEHFSGDQRRAPFKGAQSANAAALGEFLLKRIDEKYGSYSSGLNKAQLKRVSLRSLRGVQAAVKADTVARKIRELAKTDELEAPTVARFRGKVYLIDGYHTLTALKLGGVKSIQAFVIPL